MSASEFGTSQENAEAFLLTSHDVINNVALFILKPNAKDKNESIIQAENQTHVFNICRVIFPSYKIPAVLKSVVTGFQFSGENRT
jgi:hypothetical protein